MFFSDQVCCENDCLSSMNKTDLRLCKFIMRQQYQKKIGRKQFILHYLAAHRNSSGILFLINGNEVCKTAWLKVYGFTESLYAKALRSVKKGKFI